jgi:hypothetical protein
LSAYESLNHTAYAGLEPSTEFLHRKPKNMFAVDEAELKDAIPPSCPPVLEAVALQCCDVDPSKRPVANDCVCKLEVYHSMIIASLSQTLS